MARYLTALLQEGNASGIPDGVVIRVAQQQRAAKQPLDDVIVDFRFASGDQARLSLQVKSSLTISAAPSNDDFRDIISDCWLTLKGADFRLGTDRFGPVVREIAAGPARDFSDIGELARASRTPREFLDRFEADGSASKDLRAIKTAICNLAAEAKGEALTDDEQYDLCRHLILVEIDAMHDGSKDVPAAINELRQCLHSTAQNTASTLWTTLRQMARDGAGKAAIFDRPALVHALSRNFKLVAKPSLRGDLVQIDVLTRHWLEDIDADVGGIHLTRSALQKSLTKALSQSRVVQIKGLPGIGKSVLLRDAVEAELVKGPTLLLKSGRLGGTGWASFAHANGLSNAPLIDLLLEICATGSDTLFIDGIDRIEKSHRPIITDLVRTILSSPLLENWRVVMSLRDAGIEPLRNWLGVALGTTGVGTVDVGGLDEAAATTLAEAKPHLQPLLFGPKAVREIVRRPFFAKILNQNFVGQAGDEAFTPQSEVDLIGNWWLRGGYDSSGQQSQDRQRGLIELGRLKAHHLEQEIRLRDLSPTTATLINQFVEDGILQQVSPGHTIRFAHDIFFEWSFFHVLVDEEANWLAQISGCGEPPAVARVVELLSQSTFDASTEWQANLAKIEASQMRSQWLRAWLLAPISAPNFDARSADFALVVEADDCRLLQRALVWFQAERTTPNPNFLTNANFPAEERIRIADLFGWPSDFAAWGRLIEFLLARIDTLPVRLRPDVVSIFEVWQNALSGFDNDLSNKILDLLGKWLVEIEVAGSARKPPPTPSVWDGVKGLKFLRQNLARLVFQSARTRPDVTKTYLDTLLAGEDLREERFKEVLTFANYIAVGHADQLVELTLKHLLDELPEEQLKRESEEARRSGERRRRVLAKPESERTRQDNLVLSSFPHLGQSFGHHDWERLAVDKETGEYFPSSPLREPFHSLFKHTPTEALRLMKTL